MGGGYRENLKRFLTESPVLYQLKKQSMRNTKRKIKETVAKNDHVYDCGDKKKNKNLTKGYAKIPSILLTENYVRKDSIRKNKIK